MPLLNRKTVYVFDTKPTDLQPDEEVWVIEDTGEVFRSYEAFLSKKGLYEQEVWACRYTGKGGLTLEQALASEKKAVAALEAFPKGLEEQVCRAVHHSTARLDELVSTVYDGLRPAAAAEAGAATGGAAAEAEAAGSAQVSPFGSKENEGPQQGGAAAAAADKPAEEEGGGEGGEGAGGAAAAGPTPAPAKPEGGEGGKEGATGGRSGKKAKTPKAPVSKPLLRTYILENAEQQGPEHATKQTWVVKAELRQRYGLAEELPAELAAQLAASVKAPKRKLDAPKGLGTKLPAKKEKKAAAKEGGAGGASPAATGEGGAAGSGKAAREKGPLVEVKAKPWEEVEAQYKEGSLKHMLAAVLKAAQPEALTVQGIVAKAGELGLRELEEKEKGRIGSVLAGDPNFLRLSKGAYSLHCFHPDKQQLVKAPQPKEKKEGGAAGSPSAAAGAGEGSARKPAKPEVPMVAVQAKTLEEVEAQYKEGTLKHSLVAVLKAVRPEALTAQGAVDKAAELKIEGLEDNAKAVAHAYTSDANFMRLSKGAYTLHCFHPEREQLVRVQPPKEKKEREEREGEPKGPPKPEVPMVEVQAKPFEEVEAQYKEGTLKHDLVAVLKAVRPEALTVQAICEKAKELGLREFDEKHKAAIGQAMATDPNFLRLSKGAYSLHCFHPDKQQLVKAPQPKKRRFEELLAEEGEGGGAKEGGEDADSIAKAEQLVRQTKRLLALHRGELEKAQAAYDEAKAAFDAEKKRARTPAKERTSDVHIPAEALARFEVPEGEREFKGEADDRKGLLEFRQKLQARVKELEKAKKAFLEGERAKRDKAAKEEGKGAKAVETAFRKAERCLEHERRATETAEKAAAAAEKKLEKEKERAAKGEERAKDREEREKQKAVEREERERRRAEAAKAKEDAKRYPMDDLELLQELRAKAAEAGEAAPPADVAQPAWLSGEDGGRLASCLYVSDFVSQFGKQLGVKALHYEAFERVLADAAAHGGGEEQGAATLHALYQRLLEFILDDLRAEDLATAQEKRWGALLGASDAAWPEVLRRLVLTRAADEDPSLRPDKQAVMAASMLSFDPVDRLTHDQHLSLLRYLCDAALDSEKLRGVLQRREDEAADAKRDVREEMAENRRAIKDIIDADKEERKRRREEERQRAEEEAEARRQLEEQAAAAAGSTAEAADAAKGGKGAAAKPAKQGAGAGAAPMDVDQQDEPSWDLPERLREYGGDAGDRKALMQWRQEQQAERRRLEKERNRWVADQLRRQREAEAAEKAARVAEAAKQRDLEEKQEALWRAQEALEEKLERYQVRRVPLGQDRQQRRYWWGLAGHRPVVWVEDGEGRWGAHSSLAELDALVASLDRRGVRELDLAEALEKRFQAIAQAMQRAERAAEKQAEQGGPKGPAAKPKAERLEPPRRSGRQTQQVEFFEPAKAGKGEGAAPAVPDMLAALCGPAECAAVEAAAAHLLALQTSAGSLVPAPEGAASWKAWEAGVRAAAEGEPEDVAAPSAKAVRAALRDCLLQLEAALLSQSRGGLAADGDTSEEEGPEEGGGEVGSEGGSPAGGISRTQSADAVLDVVDDLFSPTKAAGEARGYLWKTARERQTWLTDVRQASTAARLAYCAAVLEQQAEPLLASLRKAAAAAKGQGGKKGGKAGQEAGAGGKGKGKAPAAASSRPVSRTTSTADLEAAAEAKAGSGKGASGSGGAKGGKRKAPPLPENARATRSRH